MDKKSLKNNILTFFLFLVASALFLAFCTHCSFLYPFCEQVDALCFHTVGKAILHGKVLYRDIYEHKGLYLYLIYALGYLIDRNRFIGVYLMEVLFSAGFMYYSYRIMRLFLENELFCKVSVVLSSVILFTSVNFQTGGYAEEYCCVFFAWILYLVLRYFRTREIEMIPAGDAVMIGVLSAVLFWIKYTLLGITAGIVVYLVIYYLSRKRGFELLRAAGLFLVGFFAGSLPALLYFCLNHAFADLWHVYFYNLLVEYSEETASVTGLSNLLTYFGYGDYAFFLFTDAFLMAVFIICAFSKSFSGIGKSATNALCAMFLGSILFLAYGIIYYCCYQVIVVYSFLCFGWIYLYLIGEEILKEGLSAVCRKASDFLRRYGVSIGIGLGIIAAFLFAIDALDNGYRMILMVIYTLILVATGEWIKEKTAKNTKLERYFLRYLPHALLYVGLHLYETKLEIALIYFSPDLWRCGIVIAVLVLLIFDMAEDGDALKERIRKIRIREGVVLPLVLLASTVYCYFFSGSASFVLAPMESTVQYKLGEYIKASGIEDPDIIGYDSIDVGLYAYLGIDPKEKYFGYYQLRIDEIIAEKERYMREGIPDYIFSVESLSEERLYNNYHLATSAQLPINAKNPVGVAILLYERNDIQPRHK